MLIHRIENYYQYIKPLQLQCIYIEKILKGYMNLLFVASLKEIMGMALSTTCHKMSLFMIMRVI